MAEITPLLIDGHITGLHRFGQRDQLRRGAIARQSPPARLPLCKGPSPTGRERAALRQDLRHQRQPVLAGGGARTQADPLAACTRGSADPVLRAAKCQPDPNHRARYRGAAGCGQLHAGKVDARSRRKTAAARHGRQTDLVGYKKLCGSMSTCTRTEPRSFGPSASMRADEALHVGLALALDQQPEAVAAADQRQRRLGRAEHGHVCGLRRGAAQAARMALRLGACRRADDDAGEPAEGRQRRRVSRSAISRS